MQVWGYLGTITNGEHIPSNFISFPDVTVNGTGDSYRSLETNSLSVLLSGASNPNVDMVDPNDGWFWNQQTTVTAMSCPPSGCPVGVAVAERDAHLR